MISEIEASTSVAQIPKDKKGGGKGKKKKK